MQSSSIYHLKVQDLILNGYALLTKVEYVYPKH